MNEMEEDVPHRPGKLYKVKNIYKNKTLTATAKEILFAD
jgi:hypothetical protein